MYDPQLARFVQTDPVIPEQSNPQDYNAYAYVRNNPIKYTDPSGADPVCTTADVLCKLRKRIETVSGLDDTPESIPISEPATNLVNDLEYFGLSPVHNGVEAYSGYVDTANEILEGDYSGALQQAFEGAIRLTARGPVKRVVTAWDKAKDIYDKTDRVFDVIDWSLRQGDTRDSTATAPNTRTLQTVEPPQKPAVVWNSPLAPRVSRSPAMSPTNNFAPQRVRNTNHIRNIEQFRIWKHAFKQQRNQPQKHHDPVFFSR